MQQSRGRAVSQRLAGYQFVGKVVIEFGYEHETVSLLPGASSAPDRLPTLCPNQLGESKNAFIYSFRASDTCGTIQHQAFIKGRGARETHEDGAATPGRDRSLWQVVAHQTGLVAATDGNLSVRLGERQHSLHSHADEQGAARTRRPGDCGCARQEDQRLARCLQRSHHACSDLSQSPRCRRGSIITILPLRRAMPQPGWRWIALCVPKSS